MIGRRRVRADAMTSCASKRDKKNARDNDMLSYKDVKGL
jgi:hypothetical protein